MLLKQWQKEIWGKKKSAPESASKFLDFISSDIQLLEKMYK